jgi:predicted DNA-binding transcriptional regulator AlpA
MGPPRPNLRARRVFGTITNPGERLGISRPTIYRNNAKAMVL